MGKIQQAFNQALGIGAIALGPAISEKTSAAKKAKAEIAETQRIESVAKEAEATVTESSYKRFGKEDIHGGAIEMIGDKDLIEPELPMINIERYEETARAAFDRNPSEANRRKYAAAKEHAALARKITIENAAKEAAESVAESREQYKDQTAEKMINTLKGILDKGGAK